MTFRSRSFRLAGNLHLPERRKPPVVIGSHGLFGTADSAKQVALAEACTAVGIGYFRFDHRGCGRSQGDFEQVTTLAGRVNDILCAVRAITDRTDTSGTFGFFGSSIGGSTCLKAAHAARPACMVLCAAPLRSRLINPAGALPEDDTENGILRPLSLHFDISGDLAGINEVLLFHGDADEIVPYDNAGEIYAALSEPKKLVTLPGGDHRMTDASHQVLFIQETVSWFKDRL